MGRDKESALVIDTREREAAREQLAGFRRQTRAADAAGMGADQRALSAAIEQGQAKVTAQTSLSMREVARRQEESHDWLCCVSDNALTAMCAEAAMEVLQGDLRSERARALDSLHSAVAAYTSQHNAILAAITTFSGKVHQHANDYMKREQLVARAFLQYLTGLVESAAQPHTSEQKKKSIAWEAKLVVDRARGRANEISGRFVESLAPYDKKVTELKERLLLTLEHVTMRMQSLLNGRDKDIAKRKGDTHKRLTRHVKRACTARRQQVKGNSIARRDDLKLEEKCIQSVSALQVQMREAMDQLWIKEHIKERRMYEASSGRTARLEASAIVLWKKHSHLAISQSEDYEIWLSTYRRNRDAFLEHRKVQFVQSVKNWRAGWGAEFRSYIYERKFSNAVGRFINSFREYSVSDTAQEVSRKCLDYGAWLSSVAQNLLGHLGNQLAEAEEAIGNTKREVWDGQMKLLMDDWVGNLDRLNKGVSRRIDTLKGMEHELEETLRMAFAQHEVEATVFEQGSCSKMERFWTSWGERMQQLATELREQQEDFHIMRRRQRERVGTKELALDLLASPSNNLPDGDRRSRSALGVAVNSPDKPLKTQNQSALHGGVVGGEVRQEDHIPGGLGGQCLRLKMLLDEIRAETYVDFRRRCNKGIEVLRKQQGDGRKRAVPGFLLLRVVIAACDLFWDQAQMNDRCVGRSVPRNSPPLPLSFFLFLFFSFPFPSFLPSFLPSLLACLLACLLPSFLACFHCSLLGSVLACPHEARSTCLSHKWLFQKVIGASQRLTQFVLKLPTYIGVWLVGGSFCSFPEAGRLDSEPHLDRASCCHCG
jgi:hypothetical protein